MKNNRNPLYSAVHYALAAGVVSTLGASNVAFAQDEEVAELERVEVTGSRIRRTDIVGPNPIQVIQREELLETGLVTVGDIMENLPIAGAGLNTNVNNGGNGAILLDLRNLGTGRLLVLVNGRRWVTFPGSSAVDLQTIPVAVIERVEILKDGASAIYGSDAIAGVVNFITRSDFTGAQASAYYGEYDEGDGQTTGANFSIGTAGERASVFMNVSYVEQEPVLAGDRPISAVPVFRAEDDQGRPLFGSSGTPEGRFLFYAPDGSFRDVTFNEGATFPDGAPESAFRPFTGGDTYNFAPDNYLLTPSQRTSLYVNGNYELTDNISFFSDVIYVKRESSQLLAANPLFIGALVGSSVYIPADNPFNPFGITLDPNTNFLLAGRRLLEAGNRLFRQQSDTFQFTGGFEGNFEMMGRFWNWETYYQWAKTRIDEFGVGEQNVSRVQIALDPALCAVTPGCTPDAIFNLFGGAGGDIASEVVSGNTGTISDATVAFINAPTNEIQVSERTVYAANLTGSLFDLPAGPLGVALGYEYRREKGLSQPDYLRVTGQLAGNAITAAAGSYSVDSAYIEFAVPILADLPLVETLEASIAARYSDYSNFGNTTNTKFGLRWQPFSDLLIRGTFGEAFRAPSVGELFQGQLDSFLPVSDPCSDMLALAPPGTVGGRDTPQPQNVIDNCIASGVPANGQYRQINTQIRVTLGGNPDLGPETAESITGGIVYSPSWLDGFDLTLDYWEYEIDNAVSSIGAQTILNGCFLAGNQTLCALIDRTASGSVLDLRNIATNIGGLETDGVDVGIHYAFPQTSFGFFEAQWDSTYVNEFTFIIPTGTGALQEIEFTNVNSGDVAFPHWKSNLYLDWSFGDWSANLTFRYIGDMTEVCDEDFVGLGICTDEDPQTPGVDPFNKLDSIVYTDAQVSYNFQPWDTRFTVGARNLTDEDPPVSYSAFANSYNPLQYDVPGIFWYANVTTNF